MVGVVVLLLISVLHPTKVYGKKMFRKLFLSIYIFTISDALFDSVWHKLYYQHKIWSVRVKKKSKIKSVSLQKCQQEVISPKWLKLAKM